MRLTRAQQHRRHEALLAVISDDIGAPGDPPRPEDFLALDLPPDSRRERVTMRLSASTLRYFRAFGPGYQLRIERVLAAWVAGRQAGAALRRAGKPATAAEAAAEARAREMEAIRREAEYEDRKLEFQFRLEEMREKTTEAIRRSRQARGERD